VMLSVLRALVLIQSARGRDWMAVSLLIPATAYLWIAEVSSHSVETLATEFMAFAGLLLLYFGSVGLLLDWRRPVGTRKVRLWARFASPHDAIGTTRPIIVSAPTGTIPQGACSAETPSGQEPSGLTEQGRI
jgi:hypothetical protein